MKTEHNLIILIWLLIAFLIIYTIQDAKIKEVTKIILSGILILLSFVIFFYVAAQYPL